MLIAAFLAAPLSAEILSGTIVNYQESSPLPYFTFGDGGHFVSLNWSSSNPDSAGYFYRAGDTDVAVATNVSDFSQITDASIYSFSSSPIGIVYDVASTGGRNSFVGLRNRVDGFYGVVRVDEIFAYASPIDYGTYKSYSGLNAAWQFQSNGTGNFSTVPEPSSIALLSGGIAICFFRGRKPRGH